jgi:hypothetical protein
MTFMTHMTPLAAPLGANRALALAATVSSMKVT